MNRLHGFLAHLWLYLDSRPLVFQTVIQFIQRDKFHILTFVNQVLSLSSRRGRDECFMRCQSLHLNKNTTLRHHNKLLSLICYAILQQGCCTPHLVCQTDYGWWTLWMNEYLSSRMFAFQLLYLVAENFS